MLTDLATAHAISLKSKLLKQQSAPMVSRRISKAKWPANDDPDGAKAGLMFLKLYRSRIWAD